MSSLRRQANGASDWLVRAVLLGRQFHGRWKLVREQRAPFQGQRRNCNHIGDRLPARVTGVMGGMAPAADSRVIDLTENNRVLSALGCDLLAPWLWLTQKP